MTSGKTLRDLLDRERRDPEYRQEWDRTQIAHEVAMCIIAYRVEHGLTQTELARRAGLKQPAIARLEAGEHQPSLSTLALLSRRLGMEFHIAITPDAFSLGA